LIKSFNHKGLEKFYLTGSKAGIIPAHASKLQNLLTRLDDAVSVKDMNVPGFFLHQLQGNIAGHWSIRVNGNWRLTFRFIEGNAEVVDYQDYH
jgi:proteic killer suppression protein